MSVVDVRSWAKRNVWRTPDGELCVRPGLRRLVTVPSTRRWVGGFSVQNPWTLEFWHYLADVGADDTDLRIRIYDDDFVEVQSLQLGIDGAPRGFSFGVVEGEIMVGGVGMPTLWGYVGGSLSLATKVASENLATTSLEVPQGIVSAVLNRIVIADGSSLFVSDPVAITGGSPRSFVAQNQNQRPGVIFGVHEGAGGMLVVVTAAGVYGLDPSAFAVQIVGSNGTDWRLLNRAAASSYDSSANVRGRIYGLTRRGYTLLDTEGSAEELLTEPLQPRLWGPRAQAPDWRAARMYGGDFGPIVADGDAVSMTDLEGGLRAWWSCAVASTFSVRGVLQDPDGGDLLLCEDGIYALDGNVDGDVALSTEAATQPRGVLAGTIATRAEQNPTVRRLVFAAGVAGVGAVGTAVRGKAASANPSATPSAAFLDPAALVIGASSWSDTATAQPTPLASVRFDANTNTNEVTVEVSATLPSSRLGPLLTTEDSASTPIGTPARGRAA